MFFDFFSSQFKGWIGIVLSKVRILFAKGFSSEDFGRVVLKRKKCSVF